jgi:6-phosphogluconolactonase
VFLFADERAVARGHRERNDQLAEETLLGPLSIDETRVRRMHADWNDLDRVAADYERELELPIDLAILGLGPDGHTASIFPGSPAAREEVRRCVAVRESPKPPARRLTLTPRALREARAVLVLATGAEKAAAVAAAFDPGSTPDSCPASILRTREWFIDRAAAQGLESTEDS